MKTAGILNSFKRILYPVVFPAFALLVFWCSATASHATNMQQLKDAQNEKKKAESGINNTQSDLDDLNEERQGLQTYLDQLNKELSQTSSELAGIEILITEKKESLERTKKELEEAQKREEEQYAAMMKRIKFMYERGNAAYLELFFHSESFADFLNKSEYVEKMSQYDRRMLEEYMETQETVRINEKSLTDEATALEALQAEALDKQSEVSGLVVQTRANVDKYEEEITRKEEELLAYEKRLEESENDIETLQAKIAEEKEISRKALEAGFSDLSSITFGADDLELMAAIIYCEAGNQPYIGQVAVGNVVMNRVKSALFPNTVIEVLYQNRQFSPVGSGRFAIALANHKATPACYQAAQDAMSGAAPVGNCLFFRTPIPGLVGTQIGGHVFY